jgi:hypothetical protein
MDCAAVAPACLYKFFFCFLFFLKIPSAFVQNTLRTAVAPALCTAIPSDFFFFFFFFLTSLTRQPNKQAKQSRSKPLILIIYRPASTKEKSPSDCRYAPKLSISMFFFGSPPPNHNQNKTKQNKTTTSHPHGLVAVGHRVGKAQPPVLNVKLRVVLAQKDLAQQKHVGAPGGAERQAVVCQAGGRVGAPRGLKVVVALELERGAVRQLERQGREARDLRVGEREGVIPGLSG